jgi:hypothetical protein
MRQTMLAGIERMISRMSFVLGAQASIPRVQW